MVARTSSLLVILTPPPDACDTSPACPWYPCYVVADRDESGCKGQSHTAPLYSFTVQG